MTHEVDPTGASEGLSPGGPQDRDSARAHGDDSVRGNSPAPGDDLKGQSALPSRADHDGAAWAPQFGRTEPSRAEEGDLEDGPGPEDRPPIRPVLSKNISLAIAFLAVMLFMGVSRFLVEGPSRGGAFWAVLFVVAAVVIVKAVWKHLSAGRKG